MIVGAVDGSGWCDVRDEGSVSVRDARDADRDGKVGAVMAWVAEIGAQRHWVAAGGYFGCVAADNILLDCEHVDEGETRSRCREVECGAWAGAVGLMVTVAASYVARERTRSHHNFSTGVDSTTRPTRATICCAKAMGYIVVQGAV